MKTKIAKSSDTSGAVLVTTVCVLWILTMLAAAYMWMVSREQQSVARDQAWNRALVIAEAGVEEAMANINPGVGPTAKAPNYGKFGWTASGNFYRMPAPAPRSVYGGSYNTVIGAGTITSDGVIYYTNTIRSTGTVSAPLLANVAISRAIEVTTTRSPLFPLAMAARVSIDLNGNKLTVDSFDSSDTVKFPGGRWNSTNRMAHGDVATLTNSGGAFTIGNGNIMGKLHTAPGGSVADVSFKNNGSVGDVAWVTGGNTGVEDGWFADDVNVEFPDVLEPYTSGQTLPKLTNQIASDSYYLNGDLTMANGDTLTIAPNAFVQIYVTGNLNLANGSKITVPLGATLQIYVGGTSATFGTVNNLGNANSFQIYGLPSVTSLTWNGNDAFVGTVYAPEANFVLNGGGGGGAGGTPKAGVSGSSYGSSGNGTSGTTVVTKAKGGGGSSGGTGGSGGSGGNGNSNAGGNGGGSGGSGGSGGGSGGSGGGSGGSGGGSGGSGGGSGGGSSGGGTSSGQDIEGAIVVNSVKMNGTFSVHYDQNLAKAGPTALFIANTWREL